MIYIEYEDYKAKYHNAQKDFDDILSEKEKYFALTQPKSTKFDKELVSGTIILEDPFFEYTNKMIENSVDERLKIARSILKDRELLLKEKKEELLLSKNWFDIIYTYYYIEKMSIRKIERKINYKYDYPICKSEIDRKLQIIKDILGQKGTKSMK